MPWQRVVFGLLIISFAKLGFSGLLYGGKTLIEPSFLKKDIKFWEEIFSKYEAEHCVYHDSKHLSSIFWVTKLPINNRRLASMQMKNQKKQIKRALLSLAKGNKPKTWLERRITRSVEKKLRHRRYYKQASNRIRCQRGVATDFRKSLKRSQRYLTMIKSKINSHGLPKDLSYLPHLESGFNNRAKSKVGARGLWQIMPSTAKQFMRVTKRKDDRINPYIATTVASRILRDNYRKTKSWPLAITAYNYGINGTLRAIRKYKTNSYKVIRENHRTSLFKFAAKNFYPSFLAVRNLAVKHESKNKRPYLAKSKNKTAH